MQLVKYQNAGDARTKRKVWWTLLPRYDTMLSFTYGLRVRIGGIIYIKDSEEFRQHLAEAREKEQMWEKLTSD